MLKSIFNFDVRRKFLKIEKMVPRCDFERNAAEKNPLVGGFPQARLPNAGFARAFLAKKN